VNQSPEEFLPPPASAIVDANAPQSRESINPDNPAWGVGAAVFVWFASVFFLLVTQFIAVALYVFLTVRPLTQEAINQFFRRSAGGDPKIILVAVAAVVPAHLLTLAVIWAVVTNFGKRPFWRAFGWSWTPHWKFWQSSLLAVALLIVGGVLQNYVGGEAKTDIDKIIASSAAARFTVAILATLTAPLVEEMIYRGVIYSAFQRAFGVGLSIVTVSTLFALVHVAQYWNNIGVILAVSILSLTLTLVRARTGRLLPCVALHFVFNGIQSLLIIASPYYEQWQKARHAAPALIALAQEGVKFLR
jgi:membrane protease YdiL (CAAX protease family)